MKKWSVFGGFILLALFTRGQRSYVSSSVLASGQWVKISVSAPGVYKLTPQQVRNSGYTGVILSDKLRIFGNGGGELPEGNASAIPDDLSEIAIEMNDGGDGFFDNNDFLLFYATGPHQWLYDEPTRRFVFRKNHYSNKAYYFLQIADKSGKRIITAPQLNNPTIQSSSFYEHYRYELDSINFLKSGKEWYGEDFSNQPGRKGSRDFVIPFSVLPGKNIKVMSDMAGRGFEQVNRIPVSINGINILEHQTSPLVGSILEPAANPSLQEGIAIASSNTITLRYQFNGSGVNAEGWLNWFEVHCTRNLDMQGLSMLHFRDTVVQTPIVKVEYRISNSPTNTNVWDISDPHTPRKISLTSVSPLLFVQEVPRIREYVAFDAKQVMTPTVEEAVENQNLHGIGAHDMVIVADKLFSAEANRLAVFHSQKHGFKVLVAEPEKIFNEFSSGSPDPSAIRNFMKMLYDRAGSDAGLKPKFLLLFGSASYIQNESKPFYKNVVPSYQSFSSLDPLTSYVSDDYFGYLDDNEDININLPAPLLDIGIGRIPARTSAQANTVVSKILAYHQASSFGSWRSNMTFVADDEDFNLHLNDAELHTSLVQSKSSYWNLKKIYLDAFHQEGGTAGSFYPDVNDAITKDINRGTLIWNYSGHGGSSRLAQEAILNKNMVSIWENSSRLPLFVTATCDFAPFDNLSQFSIGEELLMARLSGAIGLMTTTRLVFASSNKIINNNFLNALLSKDQRGKVPFLGNALMQAKNYTIQNTGDFINARKFVMLGDPAMQLGIPEYSVRTVSINGKTIGLESDTLRALTSYEFSGEIIRTDGSLASDFNGDVYPQLFDKPLANTTLGNDPQSRKTEFFTSTSLLYSGKIKAQNGKFTFRFIAPRDMSLLSGKGRLSYYANNQNYEAAGGTENLVMGGFGDAIVIDQKGPDIRGYIDTSGFQNGDIVNPSPLLFLEISDVSGINQTGSLGHEMLAVIDGDQANAINLNDLFSPTNSNLSGTIQFRLPVISDGLHTITIKVWDIFNNSNVLTLTFKIQSPKYVSVAALRCVPNPVRGSAVFKAELSGPTQDALVELSLFTIGGQQVRSFTRTINEPSLRSISIEWDGKDESGNSLGIGTYVYVIRIKTKEGLWTQKTERLIVL